MDAFLPFGFFISPALFLKYVDILSFTMLDRGASPVWNYLDDFWTCGPPAPDSCSTLVRISALIQTPKTVVPCTTLELLGIELKSVTQETRISHTRLDETLELLRAWHSKASCRQRLLLSLIGKLNLICSVCRPGRAFLSRLIELFSRGLTRAIISVSLNGFSKT